MRLLCDEAEVIVHLVHDHLEESPVDANELVEILGMEEVRNLEPELEWETFHHHSRVSNYCWAPDDKGMQRRSERKGKRLHP